MVVTIEYNCVSEVKYNYILWYEVRGVSYSLYVCVRLWE